ncbi:hypothetical protein SKAU_G00116800 [Synaphobranchus kaupii]|uniref:SNTX thioredoxin-like domain-containing protein n=1 Tax=Synaphobranchus kaupii TaxID=118154 RepID=A0A9Q1FN26_SYNKA|nr:hypothetical protein SKAU_G00116800 [Synaphobranchus kaupii]
MNVQPQAHTHLDFSGSDSFSEKTKLMDVSASLKVSFLAGLVEVGGSARYLKDKMSSMQQCRVTMQYKQTTEFKHLTMTQLGHVTYPDVFDQKIATHVVTAVLYGAEAFMVFDQMALNENDKQDIQGEMHVMIKKIPEVEISGSGKVILTDEEKKKVDKFSCTFHGDYTLEQNPTSYEEAVLLYKQLPKLLGEDKRKAVPVSVWLYPLKNLDSKAAQLVRAIGVELVSHAEAIMGQLQEAKMRANDSIRRCEAIKVPDITDKLAKFQDKLASYTVILLQNLRKVLPAIRAGTEGEQTLVDILKFHDDSSFSHDKMRKWLDEKESEIGVLEEYINSLGSVPIVPPGPELDKVLFDPQYHNIFMFTFTSLKYEEPYLSNLHECLASEEFNKMGEICVAHDFSFKDEALPWFRDPEISKRMRGVLVPFQQCEKTKLLDVSASLKVSFLAGLVKNPTSYEEAVLLYKQLPKLLGEDQRKAVPVRVWLYPLKNLDSRAAQLVREIGVELVSHAEAIMGQLQEAKMRANDSIRQCDAIKVPVIKDKLAKFQDKLASYTVILLQNIRKVLPAIRAGTEGDQTLVDILKFHDDSSFSHDKIRKWLDEKESEIGVLEEYINSLGSVAVVPPGPELDKVLFGPQYHNIFMFTFTSLKYEEPYLSNIRECLASEEFNKMGEICVAHDFSFKEEALPWFRDPEISKRMRWVLIEFQQWCFYLGKKLIISYISDTSYPGASIFSYIDGALTNHNYHYGD